MWVARQLGAPVRYLRIAQGTGLFSSKLTYDFVLPIIVAFLVTIIVQWFALPLGLHSQNSFVTGIIDLLNLLIAFFIAALAAVATFDRAGLDDRMKGEPAIMKRKTTDGIIRDHILTHRQFICYLFGYLSFSSISLVLALFGLRLFGQHINFSIYPAITNAAVVGALGKTLNFLGVFLLLFIFSQIIITMLLGIYFLCDRLQFLNDLDD